MQGSKIAVISQFDYQNFGNSLQRYAVQQMLRKRGFRPVSFEIRSHALFGTLRSALADPRPDVKRGGSFRAFAKRHGIASLACKPDRVVETVRKGFCCAVVGSDQVWNPTFGLGSLANGVCCLEGLPSSNKAALCPSFGVPTMPDDSKSRYAKWLKGFARISVREHEGAAIVRELTGMEADVLVDPTLAYGVASWRTIAEYSACPGYDYVVTCFLGNDTHVDAVKAYAQSRGLRVIQLMDKTTDWYYRSPDEFIALIDHAQLVVTDSFHAAAFSLMLHTDFVILRRGQSGLTDMSSRMTTLCRTFSCEGRLITDGDQITRLPPMDWTVVDQRVECEAARFEAYLDSELKRMVDHAR